MTSLFQARRRAEEFARVVDGTAPRAVDPEAERLLAVVGALRDQEQPSLRPEFSADLRGRLLTEAERTLAPTPAPLALPNRGPGRRERRLAVAASAFLLVGGTTTVAAAAQTALPGEALYPIKRGLEQAQAGLSLSAAGKGADLLDQAGQRVEETARLVAAGEPQTDAQVAGTLTDFSTAAAEGSTLLLDSYRESGDPASVDRVRSFTAETIEELESLAPAVPDEAADELAEAARLVHDIDTRAVAVCATCADRLPVVEIPGIFLARAEADRALDAASGRVLENSHPVVVPKGARELRDDADDVDRQPHGGAAAGGGSGGGSDDAGTAQQQEPAPEQVRTPQVQPEQWPSLLPRPDDRQTSGPDRTVKDTVEDTTKKVGETTEQLGDGLTGVVETILPDTDDLLD
jgi:hypothetical protein